MIHNIFVIYFKIHNLSEISWLFCVKNLCPDTGDADRVPAKKTALKNQQNPDNMLIYINDVYEL